MSSQASASAEYARLCGAVAGEPLPLALVDLDAVDHNVDVLLAPVRAAGKSLRVASKSLRCVHLLRHVMERGGATCRGVMAYAVREAAHLVAHGFDDILVAYPTAAPDDTRRLAELNARGATVAVVVDEPAHLPPLASAAGAAHTRIPVLIDADVSWRPLRGALHVGVRRSPLHDADAVVALAERVHAEPDLALRGVMAYEAQVAGVVDARHGAAAKNAAMRLMKARSRERIAATRRAIAAGFAARGLPCPVFNGGGTGSLATSCAEDVLTEVTAGSGFVASHLFDDYRGLALAPAALFALQVVRRPAPGIVTCHGGGYVASGEAGVDRLPRPWLPAGLALTRLEGAGEVQTPLRVPARVDLRPGDLIFFRHAKAGELAEHFREYLLVRSQSIVGRAPTYRGEGQCFLG